MNPSTHAESASRAPRRSFYRLDHRIPFAYRVVSDARVAKLERGERPDETDQVVSPTARLAALKVEANMALNQLRQAEPLIARYFQTLESRLEVIAEHMFSHGDDALHKSMQTVNLSASGIAFKSDELLPVGSWVEVEFDLPETRVTVHAYAKVVRSCDPARETCDAPPFNVGVQMKLVSDAEREMIVAYMLGRQAERIRKEREQLGL